MAFIFFWVCFLFIPSSGRQHRPTKINFFRYIEVTIASWSRAIFSFTFWGGSPRPKNRSGNGRVFSFSFSTFFFVSCQHKFSTIIFHTVLHCMYFFFDIMFNKKHFVIFLTYTLPTTAIFQGCRFSGDCNTRAQGFFFHYFKILTLILNII